MKVILCLVSAVTLLATSGCVIHEHDRDRGGYYGRREYERGEYRGYPDRHYHRDWDDRYYQR